MIYVLIYFLMMLFISGHWGWGLLFLYLYWLYVDTYNKRP